MLIKHCDTCTCNEPVPHARAAGPSLEPKTVRIVRAGQIFMKTRAGQAVEVPDRLLEHRSTILATMSVEEWKSATDEAKRRLDPVGPVTSSVDMARDFKARAAQGATAARKSGEKSNK